MDVLPAFYYVGIGGRNFPSGKLGRERGAAEDAGRGGWKRIAGSVEVVEVIVDLLEELLWVEGLAHEIVRAGADNLFRLFERKRGDDDNGYVRGKTLEQLDESESRYLRNIQVD